MKGVLRQWRIIAILIPAAIALNSIDAPNNIGPSLVEPQQIRPETTTTITTTVTKIIHTTVFTASSTILTTTKTTTETVQDISSSPVLILALVLGGILGGIALTRILWCPKVTIETRVKSG